ncbi:MAG: MFS transporter, partial [Pseudomonadota bacterium]
MKTFSTHFKTMVLPLALGEVLIWASIFYSFPALLLQWERDTEWSKTALSGAFSAALLTSAILSPLAGRLIDRGFARQLVTGSTCLAGVLLLLLASVNSLWQFYVIWIGLGAAMAGALYEPCFAILTRALGADAKRGITALTLIAGFAGTVSFPLLNALAALWGWRGAVLCAAAIMLSVAPLLVWRATTAAERMVGDAAQRALPSSGVPLRILKSPVFWLLGVSFATIALTHGLLLTHIMPLLDERGVQAQAAVLAAAMIGPMQVAGRLAMASVEGHVSTYGVAQTSFLAMGLAALVLLGVAWQPLLLVLFVVIYGSAYGVTSITRPVVIGEFLGQRDYGVIAGMLAAMYLAVVAVSPTLASVIWQVSGYDTVIVIAACAC